MGTFRCFDGKSYCAPKETGEPLTFAPTAALLQRFGHIASCFKCRALCRGEHAATLMHSTECCEQLERTVSQDAVLRRQLENVEERTTKNLADEIERAVNQVRSVTERQFANNSSTGFSGGAASVKRSCLGRGQEQTLPEDGRGCTVLLQSRLDWSLVNLLPEIGGMIYL